MIEYEWMVKNNPAASSVKEHWQNKQMKQFLYSFICLCRAGFNEEELRGFVDVLLLDPSSEDR